MDLRSPMSETSKPKCSISDSGVRSVSVSHNVKMSLSGYLTEPHDEAVGKKIVTMFPPGIIKRRKQEEGFTQDKKVMKKYRLIT